METNTTRNRGIAIVGFPYEREIIGIVCSMAIMRK
jgi:hypothetical protein